MSWTPSRDLEEQVLREINRLRDEMVRAQETERKRLANKHSAAGTLRSGQFLAEVQQDVEKRLIAFASDLIQTSIELARLTDAPTDDLILPVDSISVRLPTRRD